MRNTATHEILDVRLASDAEPGAASGGKP